MTWKPFPVPDDFKDGRKFFAAQDGEVYVAKYVTDTVPPSLVFRQHRNRVDRHYRFVEIELDGGKVMAQVPVDQPWAEEYEHIWRTDTRGFKFAPKYWSSDYEEPPK